MSIKGKCCKGCNVFATAVEVAGRNCMTTLQECQLPLDYAYAGMSGAAIIEQIRTTELTVTCRYVHAPTDILYQVDKSASLPGLLNEFCQQSFVSVNSNCRPLLTVQPCVTRTLSTPGCQAMLAAYPQTSHMQRIYAILNTTVNFVCRHNVEGMLVVFVLVFIS